MRPDVHGFVVQVEERGEGAQVAVAGAPVPRDNEDVVAAPLFELVPGDDERGFNLLLDCFGLVKEAAARCCRGGRG